MFYIACELFGMWWNIVNMLISWILSMSKNYKEFWHMERIYILGNLLFDWSMNRSFNATSSTTDVSNNLKNEFWQLATSPHVNISEEGAQVERRTFLQTGTTGMFPSSIVSKRNKISSIKVMHHEVVHIGFPVLDSTKPVIQLSI